MKEIFKKQAMNEESMKIIFEIIKIKERIRLNGERL